MVSRSSNFENTMNLQIDKLQYLVNTMLFHRSFLLIIGACHLITVVRSEEYSLQERNELKKLRPIVQSIVTDDYMLYDDYLIRFLRARQLDVDRAKFMIENAVRWRKENKIDNVFNEDFSKVEKCIKVTHGGVDREGRPLHNCNLGGWDLRKCALAGLQPEMNRYLVRHFMEGPAKVARTLKNPKTGANITEFISIMEMQGFNLRQGACIACLSVFGTWAYNYENYYPGSPHKILLVNTPQAFHTVLEFLKPVLTAHTNKALTLLGFNKKEWSAVLNKAVAPEELPVQFGGKRKPRPDDSILY